MLTGHLDRSDCRCQLSAAFIHDCRLASQIAQDVRDCSGIRWRSDWEYLAILAIWPYRTTIWRRIPVWNFGREPSGIRSNRVDIGFLASLWNDSFGNRDSTVRYRRYLWRAKHLFLLESADLESNDGPQMVRCISKRCCFHRGMSVMCRGWMEPRDVV